MFSGNASIAQWRSSLATLELRLAAEIRKGNYQVVQKNHGQTVPLLMNLAIKLINQPASSSCCERNWSTYSFIHSVKRNALTPERAEDLVFVHSNLRHMSRKTDAYKTGETRMWDVGGDSFDTMAGVGLLEVAELSLDEPELQAVSFGLEVVSLEENEAPVEDVEE